jgi:hypothetical protein
MAKIITAKWIGEDLLSTVDSDLFYAGGGVPSSAQCIDNTLTMLNETTHIFNTNLQLSDIHQCINFNGDNYYKVMNMPLIYSYLLDGTIGIVGGSDVNSTGAYIGNFNSTNAENLYRVLSEDIIYPFSGRTHLANIGLGPVSLTLFNNNNQPCSGIIRFDIMQGTTALTPSISGSLIHSSSTIKLPSKIAFAESTNGLATGVNYLKYPIKVIYMQTAKSSQTQTFLNKLTIIAEGSGGTIFSLDTSDFTLQKQVPTTTTAVGKTPQISLKQFKSITCIN